MDKDKIIKVLVELSDYCYNRDNCKNCKIDDICQVLSHDLGSENFKKDLDLMVS